MKKLFYKILCAFTGHPCTKTGRSGLTIHEVKCDRCNQRFISSDSPEHEGCLLTMNPELDKQFTQLIAITAHLKEKAPSKTSPDSQHSV